MRAFNLCLCAGLLLGSSITASGQVIPPTEQFRLAVDLARFRGADDEHATLEIYYAFPRRALTYAADSAGFTGAADITLIHQRHQLNMTTHKNTI